MARDMTLALTSAKIKRIPPLVCNNRVLYLDLHSHTYGYKVGLHGNCVCNELIAIHNRHCIINPYKPNDLLDFYTDQTIKFYRFTIDKISKEEVIARYSGLKRNRYIAACANLRENGWHKYNTHISSFVKIDKVPYGKLFTKAPRLIQGRTPEYNLCFLQYVVPMEHTLYTHLTYGSHSGLRCVAKGLNPQQRAELYSDKIRTFLDPVVISGDHKTFDAFITVQHLKAVHKKYRIMCGRGIKRYCHAQLHNKCKTVNNIRYNIKGTRMSGDADTGLGNTIISLDVAYAVLAHNGISKYDLLCDGDDFMIIVERGTKLTGDMFKPFGFNTELTETECPDVEFCQCRLVDTGTRKVFVRNPERMLSNSRICRKSYKLHQYKEWINSVGLCEATLYGDIPIYNTYSWSLISDRSGKILDPDMLRRMEGMPIAPIETPVTDEARVSFHRAWGVPPEIQLELESQLTCTHIFSKRTDKPRYGPRSGQKEQPLAELSSSSWWSRSECGH
jgi:hypothetical protein